METYIACMGEGEVGAPAGGSEREKGERERERKENRRMFTSGFALWALSLDKKCGGGSFWIYW